MKNIGKLRRNKHKSDKAHDNSCTEASSATCYKRPSDVPTLGLYVMASSAVSASTSHMSSHMSATSTVLTVTTVLDCQAYQVSRTLLLWLGATARFASLGSRKKRKEKSHR